MHTWKQWNKSTLMKGWSLLDWSRKKKSKCAAEDKHCSLSSVEVKETSAVFALWFEMVSVGNSPFSQIGLDVVSIYVFASCQDSLRKWKCSKMLAECVGTGACLSICIHVWEPVGVCMCKWVSWDQSLFPQQNLRQTHKKSHWWCEILQSPIITFFPWSAG